jgi:hypothetical protein
MLDEKFHQFIGVDIEDCNLIAKDIVEQFVGEVRDRLRHFDLELASMNLESRQAVTETRDLAEFIAFVSGHRRIVGAEFPDVMQHHWGIYGGIYDSFNDLIDLLSDRCRKLKLDDELISIADLGLKDEVEAIRRLKTVKGVMTD